MRTSRILRIASMLLAVVLFAGCGQREPELPVVASIPDFALVDQRGEAFRARELDGKVWIAAFLFTRCTSVCPMLTSQMVNFQRRLGPDASDTPFVAFTVDPAYDTPEVLRGFATARGATRGFTFLTGDASEIRTLANESFKVAVGELTTTPGGDVDILHAQHLLLVDRHRRLRGFYRTDAEGLANLERDLGRLREETR